MKCEELTNAWLEGSGPVDERLLARHLAACADCRDALLAAERLADERLAPVPGPPVGAFERAMRAATAARPGSPSAGGFWRGTVVGGALAAGIALAIAVVYPTTERGTPAATPEVFMALDETRDISIGLDSPEALSNAQIRVVLSGAIDLRGFEGRDELRWSTTLEPGVNELTLPITALGDGGGQVLVEVWYGERRRAFVVDVRTRDPLQGV